MSRILAPSELEDIVETAQAKKTIELDLHPSSVEALKQRGCNVKSLGYLSTWRTMFFLDSDYSIKCLSTQKQSGQDK